MPTIRLTAKVRRYLNPRGERCIIPILVDACQDQNQTRALRAILDVARGDDHSQTRTLSVPRRDYVTNDSFRPAFSQKLVIKYNTAVIVL